jgi:hypothetical protein
MGISVIPSCPEAQAFSRFACKVGEINNSFRAIAEIAFELQAPQPQHFACSSARTESRLCTVNNPVMRDGISKNGN